MSIRRPREGRRHQARRCSAPDRRRTLSDVQLESLFENVTRFIPDSADGMAEAGPPVSPSPSGAAKEEATASASSGENSPAPPTPTPDWLKPIPGCGGVYLLATDTDQLIQLASAGSLRRAIRSRLMGGSADAQGDEGTRRSRRADVSRITRRIWWRTAWSPLEVGYRYWQIARALLPKTYLKQVAFGPSWFVHVDPAAAIPHFAVGKRLQGPPGVDLGPFARQADAQRFLQILEDVFDLCRYQHILEQAPNGTPCAYAEMGRCAAPCDGSLPMDEYRVTLRAALSFARGGRPPVLQRLEQAMQDAAEELAFERAAALKQRLERAREIEHRAFAGIAPVSDFNYLIVQRGRGKTHVRPFFVRAGTLAPGEERRLKDLPKAVPDWLQRIETMMNASPVTDAPDDRQVRSEQIWLIAHHLFKRDRPGLFLPVAELGDAEAITAQVHDAFAPPARPEPSTQPPQPAEPEPPGEPESP